MNLHSFCKIFFVLPIKPNARRMFSFFSDIRLKQITSALSFYVAVFIEKDVKHFLSYYVSNNALNGNLEYYLHTDIFIFNAYVKAGKKDGKT